MERRGIDKPAELAQALGLTRYASPQRVRRWREGLNEPRFQETMELLEMAGLLTGEARAALGERPLPGSPEAEIDLSADRARADRLAELARGEERPQPRRGTA